MVQIGLLVVMVPASFFVFCIMKVRALPLKMRQGDTQFLSANAFLFRFFRAEVYWYGLVLMFRSLVLAMAPVVPNIFVQLFLVFVVLLSHLLAMVHLTPWRVQQANLVEPVVTITVLLFLFVGVFFVDINDVDVDK